MAPTRFPFRFHSPAASTAGTYALVAALWIFFSDRIVVLSPRPAQILEIVRVDLPRPREADAVRASSRFRGIREHLWSLLSQKGNQP